MQWTFSNLKNLKVPIGQTKLTVRDSSCSGLYFEVRASSKVFIFRKTVNGKNHHQRLGTFPELNIVEARKHARDCRKKLELGIWQKYEKSTQIKINDLFFSHYLPNSKLTHKTSHAREGSYRNHILPAFGNEFASSITRHKIRTWRNSLLAKNLSPATVNKLMVILGQLIDIAYELEIKDVPERRKLGLKSLSVLPSNDLFLSSEQLSKLRTECAKSSNVNLLTIIDLLIFTGARKREILDATWNNIDFNLRLLTVPCSKNGKPRHITLCQRALDILAELRAKRSNSFYVLPNPLTGEPYGCIFHAWDKARVAAGLPHVRVHDLRHSFASALVNSGVSLYEVQQLLGHASIKTTQRYAHLDQGRLQSSVERVSDFYK